MRKPRILFIGEAVTLAHVVRPLVLAGFLDLRQFEIHFACDTFYDSVIEKNSAYTRWNLTSIGPERFLHTLQHGAIPWPYSKKVLSKYIKDDLELFSLVNPYIVIGDFRLSLGVSTAVAKIPYINITNAYWSPFVTQREWLMPSSSLSNILGVSLSSKAFRLLRPALFHFFAESLNTLRRQYGLHPIGNFLSGFTCGDITLYADIPDLVPIESLPENHHYIGPVLWSPECSLPEWWEELEEELPLVYVTPGSSGEAEVLKEVLQVFRTFPAQAVIATAGRGFVSDPPKNVRTASFLPGAIAAKKADLVICNGGSPTSYQALEAGKPVLGICSNLDQYLCMQNIERKGAGVIIRSDQCSATSLFHAIRLLLRRTSYQFAAQKIAKSFGQFDSSILFPEFVKSLLPSFSFQKDKDRVENL